MSKISHTKRTTKRPINRVLSKGKGRGTNPRSTANKGRVKNPPWLNYVLRKNPTLIQKYTGLPVPLINKFKNKKVNPSKATQTKLKNYYRRVQYARLVRAGANKRFAKSQANYRPAMVSKIVRSLNEYVIQKSWLWKKSAEQIRADMRKWNMNSQDYKQYLTDSFPEVAPFDPNFKRKYKKSVVYNLELMVLKAEKRRAAYQEKKKKKPNMRTFNKVMRDAVKQREEIFKKMNEGGQLYGDRTF
jgi:hypothetical protein